MATPAKKRKVCFIITSFVHYSRSLLILDALKKRSDTELHIIIGGTALLAKYSSKFAYVRNILEAEGFKNLYEVYFNLEGDNPTVKAQTAGLGLIEFSHLFNNVKPDLVVVRGDRFEVLSAATAASYMRIPIAHIEGGDVTGTLDETVRHSITKLAQIHFVTNEDARRRVIQMGEPKNYVFNFGSPEIEVVARVVQNPPALDLSSTGSGAEVRAEDEYLMVLYHPAVPVPAELRQGTKTLLEVVHGLKMPTLWFWPNFDLGAEEISRELRMFIDTVHDHHIRFLRYLPPREFLALLKGARCLIGNSSAGVKECAYLGIPVVNVGSRQSGRLRDRNVTDAPEEHDALRRAIRRQLSVARYPSSRLYRAKDTSKRIAETLVNAPLYIQKRFRETSRR